LSELRAGSASREVVVLPLFMSEHEALFRATSSILLEDRQVTIAEPFGKSYLAEELLFDQVEALAKNTYFAHHASHHEGRQAPAGASAGSAHPVTGHAAESSVSSAPHLIVVADGASNPQDAARIEEELAPLARRAAERYGLHAGEVVVLARRGSEEGRTHFSAAVKQIRSAAEANGHVLLVPFNFGLRLTTMMSHWSWMQMGLHGVRNVTFGEPDFSTHPNIERWLVRTANAYSPLARNEIGVILIPHGSDYNWNETMRQSLAPISEEYVTEDAYSMVDPYVVERAVRKLEDRGMKAAIVLRIFSLESSFRDAAEYVLGLREEAPTGGHMGTPERIESHLLFHTLGGIEAHPRFAAALIDRIHEISADPANETVILLAHGTGDDAENEHWMRNLQTIADYIRDNDPNEYRDILYHTWREDWPDKRAKTIPEIRAMIEGAHEQGGTPLVIPVRTTGQGPARDLVPDLDFKEGTGFAPHPEFVAWAREQIEEGMRVLLDASHRRAELAWSSDSK